MGISRIRKNSIEPGAVGAVLVMRLDSDNGDFIAETYIADSSLSITSPYDIVLFSTTSELPSIDSDGIFKVVV